MLLFNASNIDNKRKSNIFFNTITLTPQDTHSINLKSIIDFNSKKMFIYKSCQRDV